MKINFWDKKEVKKLFQKLPHYNFLTEKPRIKHLKNIKNFHCLKNFHFMANQEFTKNQDPLIQLEAIKSSIKDLFKDLLDKDKGFKCQITVNGLLSKHKKMETQNLLLFILILLLQQS